MRKLENEIENKYLTYLKIECQERTQLQEEIRYKMIYYGKGTYYYKLLSRELEKIDFSVCDKLQKYIMKINKKDTKKNERQNSYDNYKLYNSNNQRRYKNENIINTNVTNLAKPKENNNNNITKMNPQNNHRRNHFITVIKETNKNKEKENKKEIDKSNSKNHIRQ